MFGELTFIGSFIISAAVDGTSFVLVYIGNEIVSDEPPVKI